MDCQKVKCNLTCKDKGCHKPSAVASKEAPVDAQKVIAENTKQRIAAFEPEKEEGKEET